MLMKTATLLLSALTLLACNNSAKEDPQATPQATTEEAPTKLHNNIISEDIPPPCLEQQNISKFSATLMLRPGN